MTWLLGRDGGVPLIYSDNNQSAAGCPQDRKRWAGSWQRDDITVMARFHNAVHGQAQRSLYEDDGFWYGLPPPTRVILQNGNVVVMFL